METKIWIGLVGLALATGGCPGGGDDDSAADDDDATEPQDLPVLAGECGRYAFLEHSAVWFDFDGDDWESDYEVQVIPDGGMFCEQRMLQSHQREFCYRCEPMGVTLFRQRRTDPSGTETCLNHDDPPLIWPTDADVGSTWTVDHSGRWVDCATGTLQSESSYTESHEILDREQLTLPAGVGEALVVAITRSDGEHSETYHRWIGDGLGPIQEGETRDDRYLWLAAVQAP